MTMAQWLYHYKEIQKHKFHEVEYDKAKFEFYKAMTDRVCDRLDFVALMVDKEVAGEILSKKDSKSPEELEKELMEDYEALKTSLPDTIVIDLVKKDNFSLPKMKKSKPGIFIEDGGG